jgi:putative addiction module component (TIGR02574 family)
MSITGFTYIPHTPAAIPQPNLKTLSESSLNLNPQHRIIRAVPLTLEQIVEETRHWPPEKVGELVGRLTEDLHSRDPETEAAWKTEIDRRIEEIQTGKVQGIPAEEVSARIRRILGR